MPRPAQQKKTDRCGCNLLTETPKWKHYFYCFAQQLEAIVKEARAKKHQVEVLSF